MRSAIYIAEGLTVSLSSDQTRCVPGMETLNAGASSQRTNPRTSFINKHLHMEVPLRASGELPGVGMGLPFKPTILKKIRPKSWDEKEKQTLPKPTNNGLFLPMDLPETSPSVGLPMIGALTSTICIKHSVLVYMLPGKLAYQTVWKLLNGVVSTGSPGLSRPVLTIKLLGVLLWT